MEQVKKTIEQYQMLHPGDRVLVGISGGPDSVALLHFLWTMKENYEISLYAVHMNHMIRPEAEGETENVRKLAESLGIPLKVYYRDALAYAEAQGKSLEQAGHELRFQCFRETMEEWNCNRLALGHHSGDVIESMLMHLIQGCGTKGLTAMPPVNGMIIRPLIACDKEMLIRYCLGNNLHFDVDATNFETEFFRNKIRLELLPLMKQYNPDLNAALFRLRDILSDENDYMDSVVEAIWEKGRKVFFRETSVYQVSFSAELFREQHIAIQKRLLRRMWQEMTGADADLHYRTMEQMCNVAAQYQGSQKISLPHHIMFYREYDLIGMRQVDCREQGYDVLWDGKEPLLLMGDTICFRIVSWKEGKTGAGMVQEMQMISETSTDYTDTDELVAYFPARLIQFPLRIRTRREGDRVLTGEGKHTKLKKFFIDRKIPASMRDQIPLVCCGEDILWIPGYYQNPDIIREREKHPEELLEIRCFMK